MHFFPKNFLTMRSLILDFAVMFCLKTLQPRLWAPKKCYLLKVKRPFSSTPSLPLIKFVSNFGKKYNENI